MTINKIPDKIKQIAGHRETETALSTEMSTLKSKIKTLEEQNSALTS
jgi:polyhydroxyalkanoate synthesis regulator phasin